MRPRYRFDAGAAAVGLIGGTIGADVLLELDGWAALIVGAVLGVLAAFQPREAP